MSYQTGNTLGTEVCRALGIDTSTIYSVTIEMGVNDVARITTAGYVDDEVPWRDILRRYVLMPIADWPPPQPGTAVHDPFGFLTPSGGHG